MPGWVTVEELLLEKEALERSMPGWADPVAYALGVEREGEAVEWRVTSFPSEHQLPTLVLGQVLGHRNGSATFVLDVDSFDRAIGLLEPAGACEFFEHPSLWAWQELRSEIGPDGLAEGVRIVVVVVGAVSDPVTSEADRRLRAALGLS